MEFIQLVITLQQVVTSEIGRGGIYFVLDSSTLKYYKKETDKKPKGKLDLTMGRGVRAQDRCKVDWPESTEEGLRFGIAIEGRTFYVYTDESNETAVK